MFTNFANICFSNKTRTRCETTERFPNRNWFFSWLVLMDNIEYFSVGAQPFRDGTYVTRQWPNENMAHKQAGNRDLALIYDSSPLLHVSAGTWPLQCVHQQQPLHATKSLTTSRCPEPQTQPDNTLVKWNIFWSDIYMWLWTTKPVISVFFYYYWDLYIIHK